MSFYSCECLEAEDTATPGWLEKLQGMLPKAPVCGNDAQNRIFGGGDTGGAHEFPWSALVKYEKGDFVSYLANKI